MYKSLAPNHYYIPASGKCCSSGTPQVPLALSSLPYTFDVDFSKHRNRPGSITVLKVVAVDATSKKLLHDVISYEPIGQHGVRVNVSPQALQTRQIRITVHVRMSGTGRTRLVQHFILKVSQKASAGKLGGL